MITQKQFSFGGNIRETKDFKNVVHLSLLEFPDHKLVLEDIPPIEPHSFEPFNQDPQ